MLPGSAINSAFVLDFLPCFRDAALYCSYHMIHTSGPDLFQDLFCSHKHFAGDERESETLDETFWPTRLVWLTFTAGPGVWENAVAHAPRLGLWVEKRETPIYGQLPNSSANLILQIRNLRDPLCALQFQQVSPTHDNFTDTLPVLW
jgi:hypothetical protein